MSPLPQGRAACTRAELQSISFPNGPKRIAKAEALLNAVGGYVRHGDDHAFYAAEPDYMQLPPIWCFRDAIGYYAARPRDRPLDLAQAPP